MRKVVTVTTVGVEEKKRGENSGKMRGRKAQVETGGTSFSPWKLRDQKVKGEGGENGTETSNLSRVGGDTPGTQYRTVNPAETQLSIHNNVITRNILTSVAYWLFSNTLIHQICNCCGESRQQAFPQTCFTAGLRY